MKKTVVRLSLLLLSFVSGWAMKMPESKRMKLDNANRNKALDSLVKIYVPWGVRVADDGCTLNLSEFFKEGVVSDYYKSAMGKRNDMLSDELLHEAMGRTSKGNKHFLYSYQVRDGTSEQFYFVKPELLLAALCLADALRSSSVMMILEIVQSRKEIVSKLTMPIPPFAPKSILAYIEDAYLADDPRRTIIQSFNTLYQIEKDANKVFSNFLAALKKAS